MALIKEIEFENGVVANYHRIESAQKDKFSDVVEVNIISYVSKEIRDKEVLGYSLMREYEQAVNDGDEAKAQEMREKYSDMLEGFISVGGVLFVMNKFYKISLEDVNGDISFESVYDYLKTTEDFNGATDI